MLVIKPWSNNYEYYSETRVPLLAASAWAVIGGKYPLVLLADGDLRRFVRTYWIISDASTSLCQAMEFLAQCLEPQVSEHGIFDQLPVMGDSFFGDGVYYSIVVFFGFNDQACLLIVDKFARD